MAKGRIPGPLGTYPMTIDSGTSTRTASPIPGPLGVTDEITSAHSEQLKRDLVADMGQLILDITGIFDPTPLSDGTNALVSLARGRWTDALISTVSLIPYLGDISKLTKLPRYLDSIREAVYVARTDPRWAMNLRDLFTNLKKLLDKVFDSDADELPDKARKYLQQVRHEIDQFLHPGSAGIKPAGASAQATKPSTAILRKSAPGNTITRPKKAKKKEASQSQQDKLRSKDDIDTIDVGSSGAKKTPAAKDRDVVPSKTNKDYGVAFFGEDNLGYYTRESATIGREGKTFFFMPLEDSTAVRNAADAARYTGRAPSAERAYLDDGDIHGLSFPTNGMKITKPTAADAGGWPHYLEGGHTAVKTGDGPNAGYLVNPTREFVVPGGNAVPEGSVLFKLGPNGEWFPTRKF